MSSNKDYEIINGRYVFPGNLKVPVKTIEQLPSKEASVLLGTLAQLSAKVKEANKNKADLVFSVALTKDAKLYVDYKNKQLNLYIETPKCFTQLLDNKSLFKVPWKETYIENKTREISIDKDKENNLDKLTSTLLRSAYNEKINNRGSPKIFGKALDDDFDIEL